MRSFKYHVVIAATIFAALAVESLAEAADEKSFPGSMCVEAADEDPEIEYYRSAAFNSDMTYNAYFECPVVREGTGGANSVAFANVYVEDYHGSENVSCKLLSWADDFSAGYGTPYVWSSGIGTKKLELGGLSSSYVWPNGFYLVYCNVVDKEGTPDGSPSSGVLGYQIGEN